MQAWKRVNYYGNKIVINELKQIYYLEIINILFKTQWKAIKTNKGSDAMSEFLYRSPYMLPIYLEKY